jgi:hypothetical protein
MGLPWYDRFYEDEFAAIRQERIEHDQRWYDDRYGDGWDEHNEGVYSRYAVTPSSTYEEYRNMYKAAHKRECSFVCGPPNPNYDPTVAAALDEADEAQAALTPAFSHEVTAGTSTTGRHYSKKAKHNKHRRSVAPKYVRKHRGYWT